MQTSSEPPDWLEAGVRQTLDELRLFASTAWQLMRGPMMFAAGWRDGTVKAQNPLGFFATSIGASSLLQHLLFRWLRIDDQPRSLLDEIATSAFPYLWYVAFALIVHGALRLFRVRGPLRGTLGIVLFAAGGPATIVRLAGIALDVQERWSLSVAIYATMVMSIAFWTVVARGLRGLYDADRRTIGKAMGLTGMAVGVSSALLGIAFPGFFVANLHAAMP